MKIQSYEIMLTIASILLIIELLHGFTAFVYLSFSLSLFIVGIIDYATGGFSIYRDVIIFVFGSIVFFILSRIIFANKSDKSNSSEDINKY